MHLKTGVGGFGAGLGFTGVGVFTGAGGAEEEAKLLDFTGFGRGLALLLVTKCLLAMCASNSALLINEWLKSFCFNEYFTWARLFCILSRPSAGLVVEVQVGQEAVCC